MNQNLIPVQRPDKNGVMVTRWVKPDDSSRGIRKSIPSPDSGANGKLFAELSLSVDSSISIFGISKQDILAKVRRLPEKTARYLLALRERSFDQYTVDGIITSALHHNDTSDMLENIALIYNDTQYGELSWSHQSHDAYSYITANLRGLSQYRQYKGITNFTEHGTEIERQARTLTKLLHKGQRHPRVVRDKSTHEGPALYFTNRHFVQLTIENCDTEEHADVYLDLVHSKGYDPDLIKEALNATMPMRGGVI
jgi:hypothetical protein